MKKRTTRTGIRNMAVMAGFAVAIMCLCSCSKKGSPADTLTPVSFHTDAQSTYLADNYRNFKLYANGTEEMSFPAPVIIGKAGVVANQAPVPALEETDGDEDDEDAEAVREPVINPDFGSPYVFENDLAEAAISGIHEVRLATASDFSDAKAVYVEDGCASFYNLLLGTTYYCQINSVKKDGEVFTFTTDEKAPRNLYIEGVTNARDLGGWSTEDGGKVKQGLLYRTSKFNKDESDELMITAAGIDTMVNELGIKTEIDLRTVGDNENGGITASPLGEGVKYVSLPFQSGGNILLLNKDSLAELFAVLGDEDNYPIVFHCSIGTDRTGAVAFLVNGLLGVTRDDLYRDFLFSNFGEIGSMRTPSIIKTYYDTVDLSAGSNLSEKIYNYLVGCGVNAQDLDNLKAILKEEGE